MNPPQIVEKLLFKRRRLKSTRWALNFTPVAKNGTDLRTRSMCANPLPREGVPPDTSSGSFCPSEGNRLPVRFTHKPNHSYIKLVKGLKTFTTI